jgi:hypothetical protein
MNSSAVLLTPVNHAKIKKATLTSVIDTSKKFLSGVNNAGNACFADVVDTGKPK